MTGQRCQYIFLDEGGNFDFSPNGTRYFTFTSVAMERPFHINSYWSDCKYDCIESGVRLDYFHCAEDNKRVRAQSFEVIAAHLDQLRIDSLIVEKPKTGPALRGDHRFYPEMLGYLLRHIFERLNGFQQIIVITDVIPHQKKRKAIEQGIKHTLKAMLPGNIPYRVLHHQSRSHYGLQIADYCNWAIYRKWDKGDTQYYDLIKSAIHSEFEIFRSGSRRYY